MENKILHENIAKYFQLQYHPKDTQNRNKFKFGKITHNDDLTNINVFIYGKPRGNYFYRHFGCPDHYNCDINPHPHIFETICLKEKANVGGFRIKWNVLEDTYQFICGSQIGPCGCHYGGPVTLYVSNQHKIIVTEEYLLLKNNVISKNLNI